MKRFLLSFIVVTTLSSPGISSDGFDDNGNELPPFGFGSDYPSVPNELSLLSTTDINDWLMVGFSSLPSMDKNDFNFTGDIRLDFDAFKKSTFDAPTDLQQMLDMITLQIDLAKSSDPETAREYRGYLQGAEDYLNAHDYVRHMNETDPENPAEASFREVLRNHFKDIKALLSSEHNKREREEDFHLEVQGKFKRLFAGIPTHEITPEIEEKVRNIRSETGLMYDAISRGEDAIILERIQMATRARDSLLHDTWLDFVWRANDDVSRIIKASLIAIEDALEKANKRIELNSQF